MPNVADEERRIEIMKSRLTLQALEVIKDAEFIAYGKKYGPFWACTFAVDVFGLVLRSCLQALQNKTQIEILARRCDATLRLPFED